MDLDEIDWNEVIFLLLEQIREKGKYGVMIRSQDVDELLEHHRNGKSMVDPPPLLHPMVAKDFYDRMKMNGQPCVMLAITGKALSGYRIAVCKDDSLTKVKDVVRQVYSMIGLSKNGEKFQENTRMDKVMVHHLSNQYNLPMLHLATGPDPVKANLLESEFLAKGVRFDHQTENKNHHFYICGKDKEKADISLAKTEIKLQGKSGERLYLREYEKLQAARNALNSIEKNDHVVVVDMANPREVLTFDRNVVDMRFTHQMIGENGVSNVEEPKISVGGGKKEDLGSAKNLFKKNVATMLYPVAMDKETFRSLEKSPHQILKYCQENLHVYQALSEEQAYDLDKEESIKEKCLERLDELSKYDGINKEFENKLIEKLETGEITLVDYFYVETGDELVDEEAYTNLKQTFTYVDADDKKMFLDVIKNATEAVWRGVGNEEATITTADRMKAIERGVDIGGKETVELELIENEEMSNKAFSAYIQNNWEEELEDEID